MPGGLRGRPVHGLRGRPLLPVPLRHQRRVLQERWVNKARSCISERTIHKEIVCLQWLVYRQCMKHFIAHNTWNFCTSNYCICLKHCIFPCTNLHNTHLFGNDQKLNLLLVFSLNKHTGFPINDARFSKLKNIPDLLVMIRKVKLKKIPTKNILANGLLFWETL